MIRLLLLALLFFLAYTVVSALLRALPGRPGRPSPGGGRQGEEMVRDPECGTYVPRSEAVEKVIRGRRHFFCSSRCRDAYTKKL